MLAELLGSNLRSKIIGWLFTHPDERYYVRGLARLLDVDSTNLCRELASLAELGILTAETEGRQKYYQANPSCAIAKELESMATKTAGVADILRAALAPLKRRIKAAFIYGSFARGEERSESDVDVMVIGDVSFAEVVKSLIPAQGSLKREVNPTVYSLNEFARKVKSRHGFVTETLGGKKVFLVGDENGLTGLDQE
jgi:predicted nucleotidyltransferase